MIQPIVLYGNPVLRAMSKDIPQGTDVSSIIADMKETMIGAYGVGLAAPQIGLGIKMFVADMGEDLDNQQSSEYHISSIRTFINPYIIEKSAQTEYAIEGCLSIPNVPIKVPRSVELMIRFYDENWNQLEESFSGFLARVIQHEYDHLYGKLHIDYSSDAAKPLLKDKLDLIKSNKIKVSYPVRS
jgi:peptide deformylase